jgi:hypothetical protein
VTCGSLPRAVLPDLLLSPLCPLALIKKHSRSSARQGFSGLPPSTSSGEDSEEGDVAEAAGADVEADSAGPAAGGAAEADGGDGWGGG